MDQVKASHMNAVIQFGYRLQKLVPELGNEYQTHTLKKLAKMHNVASLFKTTPNTAISIVRIALRGYHGKFTYVTTKAFPGLLRKKKYNAISKKHRQAGRSKTGKRLRRKKKGIHGIDPWQVMKNSAKALKARGCKPSHPMIPFSLEEKKRIKELSLQKEFWHGLHLSAVKIAKVLNAEFHQKKLKCGIKVRERRSVGDKIKRMQANGEWKKL